MKNTDYVIRITTRSGRSWRHVKVKDGWTRTGPNGRAHRMTGDQLLSHLLPPLAGDQPGVMVAVRPTSVSAKTSARPRSPTPTPPHERAPRDWIEPDRTTRIDLEIEARDGVWLWYGATHHYERLTERSCIPYRSPWVTPTGEC